jgi:hypothetical protein
MFKTKEFNDFGLISIEKIDEPIKYTKNQPPIKDFSNKMPT